MFDKPEKTKSHGHENSQEHPAPFFAALRDMLDIRLPQALTHDLIETVTGTAARQFGHAVGQQAFARLAHDSAMEDAYAHYEAAV